MSESPFVHTADDAPRQLVTEPRQARQIELAEILLALDDATEAKWRQEWHARERNWWHEGRDHVVVSADDVAFELGLWEERSSESEWCSECGHMTHQGHWYRSVPWGEMHAIARKIGKLVKAGYVGRDPKYPSLYALTPEGAGLVEAARIAAVDLLREAL